ncbi:hypothetical protein FOXYSP1_08332 [Fusarium oxysporum f. sp. phaseoli]
MLLPTSSDTLTNVSTASISPFCTYDLSVCVIPIMLASSRVRSDETICPATLKRLHSVDIGGTESRSRAIRDSRGNLSVSPTNIEWDP